MNHKEFQSLLEQFLAGKAELPNLKALAPEEALKQISQSGNSYHPYDIMINGKKEWYPWVFTTGRGMGSAFAGEGVIISGGKAYSFTMCEHKWNNSGANPARGWHPAICRTCSFDASIDSGD